MIGAIVITAITVAVLNLSLFTKIPNGELAILDVMTAALVLLGFYFS